MNIEQRILNLENKIRMQRTALVALVSTIGVSMLMGLSQDTKSEDATFKNVIASSITIVDKDGKHVITIGSGSEEEGPGIAIMDGGSIPRIAIGINPEDNGGGIAFMDTKSNPRIAMGTNEKGEAGIALFGAGLSAPLEGKTWPTQ
ncbi:MAG: hypothetical protein H8E83_00205 [Planctomycetes bacterium]|nr:hypothetical protein [Planctomycetota bacterium]